MYYSYFMYFAQCTYRTLCTLHNVLIVLYVHCTMYLSYFMYIAQCTNRTLCTLHNVLFARGPRGGGGGESKKQQDFSKNWLKIMSLHLCLFEIRKRRYRRFYRVSFPKTSISTFLQIIISKTVNIDVFTEYHFRKRRYRRFYRVSTDLQMVMKT